jgi:hypothetical protein
MTTSTIEGASMTTEHFHADDFPLKIKILAELIAGRVTIGFVPLPSGAFVDWWDLELCGLSSTEKATAAIARGISVIERCGGFPGHRSLSSAIAEAIEDLR